MGQRTRHIQIILLKCVVISLVASGQQAALGNEMAIPPRLAATVNGKPDLVVAEAQATGGDMVVAQETKNADTPVEPRATTQEIRSITPQSNRKQRRRKPRMAGVPAGSQVVVQETKEPIPQAVAQETNKTGAPAKPQANGQATEEVDIFAPAKPQANEQATEEVDIFAPAKPQAEEEKIEKASVKHYRMAPIRWVATVSEGLGWGRESITPKGNDNVDRTGRPYALGSRRIFTNTQTAGVNVSTFVLKPSILQMGGGIGVVSTKSRTNGFSDPRINNLYGNGTVGLFQSSRIPFSATYLVEDSRTTNYEQNKESFKDDTVTKTLTLSQSYRPLRGYSTYDGTYTRRATNPTYGNFASFGANAPRGFNSNYSIADGRYHTLLGRRADEPFDVTATHTVNDSEFDNTTVRTNIFTVRHVYMPSDSLLMLQSNASLTETGQGGLNKPVSAYGRYLQARTSGDWQPEDVDMPLFVDGSASLLSALSKNANGKRGDVLALNGDLHALYRDSPSLTYEARGKVANVKSNGLWSLSTSQQGGFTYNSLGAIKNPELYSMRSDIIKNKIYSWDASGSVANYTAASVAGSGSSQTISAGVGHSLSWDSPLSLFGKKSKLNYNLGQSLGGGAQRISGKDGTFTSNPSGSLANFGSVSWFGSEGEKASAWATLSVVDTHTFNPSSQSTAFNLSLGEANKAGISYSGYGVTANAGLSFLVVRNPDGTLHTRPGAGANASASYSIRKRKLFGVRGLDYLGKLNMSGRKDRNSLASQNYRPDDSRAPFDYRIDQALAYKIGLNEMLLTGTAYDDGGVKYASLFILFRAWRSIGN